jgi:hypothetical protein
VCASPSGRLSPSLKEQRRTLEKDKDLAVEEAQSEADAMSAVLEAAKGNLNPESDRGSVGAATTTALPCLTTKRIWWHSDSVSERPGGVPG